MPREPLYPHVPTRRQPLFPHASKAREVEYLPQVDITTRAQDLVNRYTGVELNEKLWEAYEEIKERSGREAAQKFLDQEVTATVWHGTRRKEPIEQLREYGFCTYTDEQAVQWLEEAVKKLHDKTKVGPRISKELARRQANILYETRQPYRHKFSVTGIEAAACGEDDPENLMSGWAARNPEFIWDMLWSPWRVKPKVVDEILTEMFGEQLKVRLRLKVEVRQLFGPQDIHLKQRCFRTEEIISIERCPPKVRR